LPKIEEDGKSWLRKPKLCTKSRRAALEEEVITVVTLLSCNLNVLYSDAMRSFKFAVLTYCISEHEACKDT
jgi:hypothetical protein